MKRITLIRKIFKENHGWLEKDQIAKLAGTTYEKIRRSVQTLHESGEIESMALGKGKSSGVAYRFVCGPKLNESRKAASRGPVVQNAIIRARNGAIESIRW